MGSLCGKETSNSGIEASKKPSKPIKLSDDAPFIRSSDGDTLQLKFWDASL